MSRSKAPAEAPEEEFRKANASEDVIMAIKTLNSPVDAYLDRIKKFPLISIRDDEHLAEARKVLNRLVMADLDTGSRDYLDALTILVEKYEDENVSIPDAPAPDVLRLLMTSNKLSQNKLAKKVGIPQSTISEILSGTKQMNVRHMVKLSALFGVAPAVFMAKGTR